MVTAKQWQVAFCYSRFPIPVTASSRFASLLALLGQLLAHHFAFQRR